MPNKYEQTIEAIEILAKNKRIHSQRDIAHKNIVWRRQNLNPS